MTPALRGHGTGEIAIEVGVHGARKMRCVERADAPQCVGEIEAAVDDEQRRIVQLGGEFCRLDQRCTGGGHTNIIAVRGAADN